MSTTVDSSLGIKTESSGQPLYRTEAPPSRSGTQRPIEDGRLQALREDALSRLSGHRESRPTSRSRFSRTPEPSKNQFLSPTPERRLSESSKTSKAKKSNRKKSKSDYIFVEEYEDEESESDSLPEIRSYTPSEWRIEDDYDYDRLTDEEEDTNQVQGQRTNGENFQEATLRTLYVRACRSMGIQPVNYFSQHIMGPSIQMRHHMLGCDGVRACAIALVNNDTVTELDLTDNAIGDQGADYIAQTIDYNTNITQLTLSENNITNEGMRILVDVLKNHRTVEKLDISNNHMTETCAVHLSDLIESNHVMTWLSIKGCQLGNIGGQIIGASIGKNKTLEYLDLSWNHLRLKGAIEVAKGIKANDELHTVDLGWNGLSMDGCIMLSAALCGNTSLRRLELANNRINKECLMHLVIGLQGNSCLEYLGLSMNPIATDGATSILQALKDSSKSALQHLDLTGQTVDQHFKTLMDELTESRAISITHGRVLVQTALEGDGDNYLDEDPMMVLMEFMKQKNMRLVDLFTSLDTDGSKSLDYDEFRDGLKSVNIPLSREGIDKLLKRLDLNGDGEVDFKELMEGQKEFKRKVMQIQKALQKGTLPDNPLERITKKVAALLKARQEEHEANAKAKTEGKTPSKRLSNITKAIGLFATMGNDT